MFLLLKSVPRLHSPATFQNQPGSLDLEGEAAPGTVGRGRKRLPLAENAWKGNIFHLVKIPVAQTQEQTRSKRLVFYCRNM